METQVLNVQELIEVSSQTLERELVPLTQLQLAVIGGGCAEVCPY